MKIQALELRGVGSELEILNLLANDPAGHRGRKDIVQLLDHFDHLGPNGTHQCLVLEVLGRNMQSVAEHYPSVNYPEVLRWKYRNRLLKHWTTSTSLVLYMLVSSFCAQNLTPP